MLGFVAIWAVAPPPTVLLVGNSYTERNDLAGRVSEAFDREIPAWDGSGATAITTGGKTLAQHLADADGTLGDTPLRRALVTEPAAWRLVTLQDQSQIPGFPQSDPEWTASRDAAVALDALIEDTGADTLLMLTWGRRAGDGQNPDRYPDFQTMQDHLTEGYLAYAAAASSADRPTWVAPIGEAFRIIHDDVAAQGLDPTSPDTAFGELYADDGSHPSVAGTALAAMVVLGAWTGRRATVSPELEGLGLDAARQEVLARAAAAVTVDAPTGRFDFPWVFPFDGWEGPIDGALQRPAVILDHAATAPELVVGDGRLILRDGAALVVDRLDLGTATDALDWRGGALDAGTVEGSLALPDTGELRLRAPTVVHGAVGGTGTLSWTGTTDERLVVLRADALALDAVEVVVPSGYRWTREGDALVVAPDHEGGDGCGCAVAPRSAGWLAIAALAWVAGRRRGRAVVPLLLLAGCAASHGVRPLPRGTGAVTASLGGPISGDLPTPIAFVVPLTTVGYAHGVTDAVTVHGALHPTELVALGLVTVDAGVAGQVLEARGARPRLMLDGDLILSAGDNAPGGAVGGARLFPNLEAVASWDLGPHAVYGGVNQLVQPFPSFRYHASPLVGAMLTAGRTDVQLEYRWLAPTVANDRVTAEFLGPFGRGASAFQLGLGYRFGRETPKETP